MIEMLLANLARHCESQVSHAVKIHLRFLAHSHYFGSLLHFNLHFAMISFKVSVIWWL